MLTIPTNGATPAAEPFEFNGHLIRVISDDNGEPWFVAKEVADVLEYSDAEAMTRRLDDDEKQTRQIVGFGNRGATIINESGLFASILGSNKPEAKAFKRWVTHDVLPAIRRTGKFETAPALPQSFAAALRLAADQQDTIAAQAEQLAAAAPAVEFVEKFVDASGLKGFREVAKLLKVKENEFSEFLVDREIMYRLAGRLTPYAPHLDAGRFAVKAGTSIKTGHAYNSGLFTAKGVQWVAGEFAKWQLKQKEGVLA